MTASAFDQSMLEQRTAKGFLFGTQRLIDPARTVDHARRFMKEMGITRVADVTGLDFVGIPVTMVCRPNSLSLAVSQGKGLTLDAAKASGLMESIELFHAERITLPLQFSSYNELRRMRAVVDATALPFCLNSRFTPNIPLLWVQGFDLVQEENVFVPFEMVNMSTAKPEVPAGNFVSSSNGLASGNHVLEAIIHGICEVVERDATTLWHLHDEGSQQQSRIDLGTVYDASCRQALEKYEQAGLDVVVWDITADTGIPAFQCLAYERNGNPARDLYAAIGMGSHPTRHIALLRALTEAAQSRLTLIAGSRDDVFRDEYEKDSQAAAFLSSQKELLRSKPPIRRLDESPSCDFETFNEDVAWLLKRLANVGIDRVIVVNLTKAEFGLTVVKVIIPKLESFDKIPSYCPGSRALAFAERRA